MMMKKRVLITGAASGIGKNAAIRFMEQGCKVVGCDIDRDGLEALARPAEENGWSFEPQKLDLACIDSFEPLYTQIEKEGNLDVLVNCAGICSGTRLDEMTPHEWDRTYSINVKGPFFLTQKLIPLLKRGREPVIINVSSMAGFTGGIQSNPAYSSSKAAVTCMTKNLAKFCAPFGIRVNEVSPGTARTSMTENWLGEEGLAEFVERVPLGRLAEAEDIAGVIVFLASQDAGFITGQSVHVNGGMYIP